MLTRRKWIIAGSVTAITVAAVVAGSAGVSAQPETDWSLNATQVAQARQALMLVATKTDPATAGKSPRVTGAWPANIASARAFGTDRAAANAAMGEPKGAPESDTRHVVCAEAHGQFSTATLPHPPGAPAQTYSYAVICFDPTTGNVMDTGYDNKPVTGTFASSQALNVTNAITGTVK